MRLRWLFPAGLLALFAAQCFYFAWDNGQTIDETFYNGSGYRMVRYNDYQMKSEHPPLIPQLGSLPLLLLQPKYPIDQPIYVADTQGLDNTLMGARFLYEMGNDAHLILFLERSVIILIAICLGWILYRWAYQLYGFGGATLALTLYSFCPNIITYASQFTTDSGVTAFFFFALYRLKRFFEMPTARNAVWTGLFCGLAFLSKISAFMLFPTIWLLFLCFPFLDERFGRTNLNANLNRSFDWWIVALSVVFFVLPVGQKMAFLAIGPLCAAGIILTETGGKKFFASLCRWIFYVVCYVLCACFLVSVGHKRASFILLASAVWVVFMAVSTLYLARAKTSSNMRYLAKIFILIWLLASLVIVLDHTDFYRSLMTWTAFRSFVGTFNIASNHALTGHGGCVSASFISCDWKYFAYSVFFKTPIVTVFLFFLGLCLFPRLKISKMNKALVILPPLLFFIVASFVNRIYIGVRHVLPVYPFLFLIAGAIIPVTKALISSKAKRLVLGMALFIAITFTIWRNIRIAPHYFSYFNELLGSPENGVKQFQVNIGQDHKRLAQLMKEKNIPSIRIASTSGNPPEYQYYGMRWEYVQESDYVNPRSGYYALDLETCRDRVRHYGSCFNNLKPKYKAGHTFYVFEVV